MSLKFRYTEEELAFRKLNYELHLLKENWEHLLELILEDSSVEEILKFASRLENLPRYTKEQESARQFIRSGADQIRRFRFEHGQGSFYWEDHKEDPVPVIELPKNLVKKGQKSWIITL